MSEESSAFRVFSMENPRNFATIRKRLMERQAIETRLILAGACEDWADYRHRVGRLQGIDEALQACEDIERAERPKG